MMNLNTKGIWSESLRLGGKPCVRGHRFSVSQLLAELAEGNSLQDIAENFEIELADLTQVLWDLAKLVNDEST